MRRIGLGVVLALSLALAPLATEAQQVGTVWRIGVLSALYPSEADPAQAFRNDCVSWATSRGRTSSLIGDMPRAAMTVCRVWQEKLSGSR